MRLSAFLGLFAVGFAVTGTPSIASIAISNAPTANMACSAGVCSPTAADAVLNVQDLTNLLAAGSATVTTTGRGVQATNIRVDAWLRWSAATTLTLDAFRSIDVHRRVTVAGPGAVALTINDGGNGGQFACSDHGRLQFDDQSSVFSFNGTAYELVYSIASLASGIAANPSGAFALAKSYDAKNDGTYVTSPVQTVFSGSFDGLGNNISNIAVNDPTVDAYVGLFAETATGATIANVRLINEAVQGGSGSQTGTFIGGLIGYADGGTIAHSFTSGTVSGEDYTSVGGLIGFGGSSVNTSGSAATVSGRTGQAGGLVGGTTSSGSISDSYATGKVSGSFFVGGLIGLNYISSIKHSWANGSVSSGDSSTHVGGLAGMNYSGTVNRSFASGAVSCAFDCGGLIGLQVSSSGIAKVSQSFATGSVTSTEGAGGLVGYNEIGEISNSYATGAVSGQLGAGGLVGTNESTTQAGYPSIADCYAAGAVSAGSGPMGGLVGYDEVTGTIKHAYWDVTTSGITNPSQGAGNVANDPGIKGLSDSQLKSGLPRGFDPKIWSEDLNISGGRPYLTANPPQS